jgi:transposase-like protein
MQGVRTSKRRPYPPEFRAQAIRLIREGGRSPEQLARELGCTAQSIRNWVRQADLDAGRRSNSLSSPERDGLGLRRSRSEDRAPEMERELLRRSHGLVRQGERPQPVTVFRFIEAEKARSPIAFLCRQLDVSKSGYYAWLRRGPSARARADAELTELIRTIHTWSGGTYGAPRIHARLAEAHGIRCGRKRVARLMRAAGLVGSAEASRQ